MNILKKIGQRVDYWGTPDIKICQEQIWLEIRLDSFEGL